MTRLLIDKTPGDRMVVRQRAVVDAGSAEPTELTRKDAEPAPRATRRAAEVA